MRKGRRFVNPVYYSSKTVHFGHKILHFTKKQIMTPLITTFNCRLLINPNYITVDDHQEHNFFFIAFDTNQIYRPLELFIKYQEYFSLLTRTSDVSASLSYSRHGSISVFAVYENATNIFRLIQGPRL